MFMAFAAVVAITFFVVYCAFGALLLIARHFGWVSPRVHRIFSTAVIISCALGAFIVAAAPSIAPRLQSKEATFRQVLGEKADAEFELKEASRKGGYDYGLAFLKIEEQREGALDLWLRRNRFMSISESMARDDELEPVWWTTESCGTVRGFNREELNDWDRVSVWTCTEDNAVYVLAEWIE